MARRFPNTKMKLEEPTDEMDYENDDDDDTDDDEAMDDYEQSTFIWNLPSEILFDIFKYLNYGDVQCVSMTCRNWMNITNDKYFRSNTMLTFVDCNLQSGKYPMKLFEKSTRTFPNIKIIRSSLNNCGNWFSYLKSVRSLEIRQIDINSTQLFFILNQLKQLENLHISGCRGIFEDKLFKRNCNTRRTVARVLLNLKELRLDIHENDILSNIWQFARLVTNLEILVFTILMDDVYETEKLLPDMVKKNSKTIQELGIMNMFDNYCILRKCGRVKDVSLKKLECWYGTTEHDILTLLSKQSRLVEFKYVNGFHKLRVNTGHILNVEVLNFSGMKMLTRDNLMVVSKLKKLRNLDISRCQTLTPEDLRTTIGRKRNENMRILRIGNMGMSDRCITDITENLPNLEQLDVTSSVCFHKESMTDIGAQAIFKNLLQLKDLAINSNVVLTDFGITGRRRSNTLRKCKQNVSNGYSIRRLRGLKRLQLAGCTKLTSESINELEFQELSVLKLPGNDNITCESIQNLCMRCPSLQVLDMTGSPLSGDSVAIFGWLTKNMFRLKSLILPVVCSYSTKYFHELYCRKHSGVNWQKVIHCNCKNLAQFRKVWTEFSAFK